MGATKGLDQYPVRKMQKRGRWVSADVLLKQYDDAKNDYAGEVATYLASDDAEETTVDTGIIDPHRLAQLVLHVLGKKQLDPPLRLEEQETADQLREEIGDVESKGYVQELNP